MRGTHDTPFGRFVETAPVDVDGTFGEAEVSAEGSVKILRLSVEVRRIFVEGGAVPPEDASVRHRGPR